MPGEDDVTALARELDEELGCRVVPESVISLGVFDCVAANEPDRQVNAAVYAVNVTGALEARAEIDEIIWIDPASPPDIHLAPLTRDHVLPLARGALSLAYSWVPVGIDGRFGFDGIVGVNRNRKNSAGTR